MMDNIGIYAVRNTRLITRQDYCNEKRQRGTYELH